MMEQTMTGKKEDCINHNGRTSFSSSSSSSRRNSSENNSDDEDDPPSISSSLLSAWWEPSHEPTAPAEEARQLENGSPTVTTNKEHGNEHSSSVQFQVSAPQQQQQQLDILSHKECFLQEKYHQLQLINEGSFGFVWKARSIETNESVALKQIELLPSNDYYNPTNGIPKEALREMKVLFGFGKDIKYFVSASDIIYGDGTDDMSNEYDLNHSLYIVMELMGDDLLNVLDQQNEIGSTMPLHEIKDIMCQILLAIDVLHSHNYMHRDIKPSNFLTKFVSIDNNSHIVNGGRESKRQRVVPRRRKVVLCDFGSTVPCYYDNDASNTTPNGHCLYNNQSEKHYTIMPGTLWYRAPELLFAATQYGSAIDMWSVGCIFGEMISGRSLFQGRGEINQTIQIFQMLGGPTLDNWPSFDTLPNAHLFKWRDDNKSKLRQQFSFQSEPPIRASTDDTTTNDDVLLQSLLTNGSEGANLTNPEHEQLQPFERTQAQELPYLDEDCFVLLEQCLRLDPSHRIKAKDALRHPAMMSVSSNTS